MRILILGASGYTGRTIREVLQTKYNEVYGTYFTEKKEYEKDNCMFRYQLGDDNNLKKILEIVNPDIVISSLTGDFSLILNLHNMIANYLGGKSNTRIVFMSTANVYDGELEKAHSEADRPKAISDYGKFKIECENILLNKLNENTIIIRVPEIWGKNCPRVVKLRSDIKNSISIQTYENIYLNYTTNNQIAEWILYIIENDLRGIFHVGSKDICEYTAFRNLLCKRANLPTPQYNVEKYNIKSYLAVIPNRKEIPKELQRTIAEIITETVENK